MHSPAHEASDYKSLARAPLWLRHLEPGLKPIHPRHGEPMPLSTSLQPDHALRTGLQGLQPVTTTGPTLSLGSAVSWGAIAAGAAAAASLSLILLILGVGLGLSSVSPWSRDGISASTFGVSTILWLTLTQLAASAMGGYLAGRLRTRWTDVHSDEVYFRDTAHGFLAWALASLATAALLTSAIGSILDTGVQAGASMAGGVAGGAGTAMAVAAGSARTAPGGDGASLGYQVDSLFRRAAGAGEPSAAGAAPAMSSDSSQGVSPNMAAEIGRIFMNARRTEPLPIDDLRYVAQVVAQRTGLSQQDAEKRVAAVHAKAQAQARDAETAVREASDKARKASAYAALWLFVSLLIGAFVASLAATAGGRRRDA